MALDKTDLKHFNHSIQDNYEIFKTKDQKNLYHIIKFQEDYNNSTLKTILKRELAFFIKPITSSSNPHVFVVGLGNSSHTADAIGPKSLKYIKANSHLEELGAQVINFKISTLAPGVLGDTGIEVKRIIEGIIDEIHPDFLIVIDSYVTNNIDFLNKSFQITNEGIIPGSGIGKFNSEINYKTVGIPVIVIGVPTAIEITFKENNNCFLLTTNDIDTHIKKLAMIIGTSLNEIFYHL